MVVLLILLYFDGENCLFNSYVFRLNSSVNVDGDGIAVRHDGWVGWCETFCPRQKRELPLQRIFYEHLLQANGKIYLFSESKGIYMSTMPHSCRHYVPGGVFDS